VMPGISAFKHDQGNPFTVSKGKGIVSRDDFFKSKKPFKFFSMCADNF
jgi:hypothetical protein